MQIELDLDTMLREPIVRMMMERDGIAGGDVRQLFQKLKSARSVREREAWESGPAPLASTDGRLLADLA